MRGPDGGVVCDVGTRVERARARAPGGNERRMPVALPVAAVTRQHKRVHLELFSPTDLQLSPDTIMPPGEMLFSVVVDDGSGVEIMQPGQQLRVKTCNFTRMCATSPGQRKLGCI